MTRWARGHKKKHIDASSWDELKRPTQNGVSKKIKDENTIRKISKKSQQKNEVKREKDRDARRKRRNKKKICYNCRKSGHALADCPLSKKNSLSGACFKCGSTEHAAKDCKVKVAKDEFPFARCFICSQEGHISRNCPDNPRGLYPFGGGCSFCDSVEHFKKDCPENPMKHKETRPSRTVGKRSNDFTSVDAEQFSDDESNAFQKWTKVKKPKVVKF